MKSVLISIKPKWCELIASGKKTIEVRKTKPKLDTPFKCYIYCTKARELFSYGGGLLGASDQLYRLPTGEIKFGDSIELMCCDDEYSKDNFLNGKVIGEFVCDEIIEILPDNEIYGTYDISDDEVIASCLVNGDLWNYGKGKTLYGFHISDLVIYDEPKELKRFGRFECEYCSNKKECLASETIYDCSLQRIDTRPNNNMYRCDGDFLSLKHPPQSWCYVAETNR